MQASSNTAMTKVWFFALGLLTLMFLFCIIEMQEKTETEGIVKGLLEGFSERYQKCASNDLQSLKADVLSMFKTRTDPEESMNATQLITSKGLPCEEHYPQTSDGYILGMQRIPQSSKNRLPVLLLHGLLSSSDCFLTNLINESLAYILYREGYDVWLGNVRGNRYSKKHVSMSPDQYKFWQWSFDEMGKYDLPAMVDYIINATGHRKVNYIGHSQGNTCFLAAAMSLGESFSEKIEAFIALAPAGLVSHMSSPLKYLKYVANDINFFYRLFGDGDFLPHDGLIDVISKIICPREEKRCENVLFLIGGTDFSNTNLSRVPVYAAHNPAGTSTRNMIHWAQMAGNRQNNMKYFNYGKWYLNLWHYGQREPPVYDFNHFRVPAYIFCGGKDTLVVPRDCSTLKQSLPWVAAYDFIPSFTHLDFIYAMDSPTVLYSKVLQVLSHH